MKTRIVFLLLSMIYGTACAQLPRHSLSVTPQVPHASTVSSEPNINRQVPTELSDIISLEKAMKEMIRPHLGLNDVPARLTPNGPSAIEYVNAMLHGTEFSAKEDLLDADTLRLDIEKDRMVSLLHLFALYDNSGHALAYWASRRERADALGVWILLRGVTSDNKNLLFDNPVDADGEMMVPFDKLQNLLYIRIDKEK